MAGVQGEYRNYHMHRCSNSLAAQGQYDGRDWRLTATASNQRVRFERRFPIGAYHSSQPEHWQQNMQELRWATRGDEQATQPSGQAGSGRRWDAVLGLYRQRAQQQRSSQFTLATVPASMPATHSTGVSQTLAAYGDLTWHATPRMDVGAGLRLSRDESRTQFGGGAGTSAFAGSAAQAHNTWQGRLNAGWQFSPQWRSYANLAQGFRRERSASYEVGARLTTARLQGNFALYRIRTRDVQLYTSEIGQQVLRNVGHARSSGIEGQIEWLLPHGRTGAASVALGGFVNRSIYTEYFDAACAACIGKRVPHTPASGLNITLKGRFQVGPHTLRQGGYTLLDAALSWHPTPGVEVRAWAHNLTNKTVRNYGFTFGGTPLAQLAAGRTAGVTLEFNY